MLSQHPSGCWNRLQALLVGVIDFWNRNAIGALYDLVPPCPERGKTTWSTASSALPFSHFGISEWSPEFSIQAVDGWDYIMSMWCTCITFPKDSWAQMSTTVMTSRWRPQRFGLADVVCFFDMGALWRTAQVVPELLTRFVGAKTIRSATSIACMAAWGAETWQNLTLSWCCKIHKYLKILMLQVWVLRFVFWHGMSQERAKGTWEHLRHDTCKVDKGCE